MICAFPPAKRCGAVARSSNLALAGAHLPSFACGFGSACDAVRCEFRSTDRKASWGHAPCAAVWSARATYKSPLVAVLSWSIRMLQELSCAWGV